MIVLATLAGGVLSVLLAATAALTVLARWADRLVSFAVGVLLPEASNALGPEVAGAWLLGGMLLFFVFEKLALWRHEHQGGLAEPQLRRPSAVGPMILLGDGMHNFIDGVLIAAAFLQDPAFGVATAVAIVLRTLPAQRRLVAAGAESRAETRAESPAVPRGWRAPDRGRPARDRPAPARVPAIRTAAATACR
ncbi:MAG: hypothetical protein MUC68_00105 [Burkholderiaceae bacterium]|jgi:zinc and cadmium transporter|nr:hypothetical protein [Burkholderiaceae bacterium]